MVKSLEVDKDVKLVSCPMMNDNAEKLHAQGPSLKVSKSNGINDASIAKVSSAVVAKDIQYVEDEYLPTVDEKCKGHHLEKENQKKASNLGKSDLKNHQSHLSLDCGDIKTVRDHKIDVTMEVGGMRDSKMVKYDVSEKVDSPQLGRTDSLDSSLRCGHTPLRRPRSPSPRASHDNMNKKPAMICQFYAKGWCIKGKLCKFLHQNDGNVTADQQAKEDKAGLSLTGNSLGSKGSENIVEEPRIISPSLVETNKAGSSECNTFLQRAFVPAYGTGSHESSYENTTFHGARQTRDVFFDKYRHHLDNYSSDSWQYQNSGKPLVYGSTEDIDGTCKHRKFPNQETHSLLGFQGSLNSGLSSSYQLSDHNFSRAATSSNRGSTPSADCIEGHNSFDFDRGCHRSRSASLTRNFSPYRGLAHHNVLDDPLSWQKTKTEYDAWEPSQPFRPSFSLVTSNISSPQSQYDPILDSIEPESARGHSIPTSMPATTNNMLHASGNAFSQTYEGALARNTSLHDSDVFGAVDIISESSKLKGERYMIDDEKVLKQDNPMERLNSKAAKAGGALRNPIDQSRRSKESKAYKAFNASLVDFVKELLKPWWREGCLSKDAHKSIVKKSAEKVLSALPSHQIPSSPEAINQYLTASRPKLTKLVEGYVEKYVNS
ncbi:Zinc finger CCCH domain-containing protein 27 [Apostasia shenzhenica]|uniref:Zinc finger CCCH domain-containing protein 27 n=1 Tax=Apostasia shenzhenica TaxID=1088818 RepID=A0A2I0B4Y7_9ASPA|nr:Zinc finger CCCH domain-containing protein 27 [Apostasia shenzhenica]